MKKMKILIMIVVLLWVSACRTSRVAHTDVETQMSIEHQGREQMRIEHGMAEYVISEWHIDSLRLDIPLDCSDSMRIGRINLTAIGVSARQGYMEVMEASTDVNRVDSTSVDSRLALESNEWHTVGVESLTANVRCYILTLCVVIATALCVAYKNKRRHD